MSKIYGLLALFIPLCMIISLYFYPISFCPSDIVLVTESDISMFYWGSFALLFLYLFVGVFCIRWFMRCFFDWYEKYTQVHRWNCEVITAFCFCMSSIQLLGIVAYISFSLIFNSAKVLGWI